MDLTPLLEAHAYLRVERPPELWEADVDAVALGRVVGEMIGAAIGRGTARGDVVLRANNVTVEPAGGGGDDDTGGAPVPGDYVALTVVGHQGDWASEVLRWPGIPFAYTRSSGVGGSVTVFLARASGQAGTGGPG